MPGHHKDDERRIAGRGAAVKYAAQNRVAVETCPAEAVIAPECRVVRDDHLEGTSYIMSRYIHTTIDLTGQRVLHEAEALDREGRAVLKGSSEVRRQCDDHTSGLEHFSGLGRNTYSLIG
jgi:hypothetical protein